MRLILIGPPGSGKGTQAKLLSQGQRLEHIGTGDILREAVRLQTPLGKLAAPFLADGKLVPDKLVNDSIAEKFIRDRPERFVMDGYPRTLAQAVSFDNVLRQQFLDLSAVLVFEVDEEEIVKRMGGRWTCPTCKSTFHLLNNPPSKHGICDECGTKLFQRPDDKEETARERLRVHHDNTDGLIDYYRARALVRDIPGMGGIEEIYARILAVLSQVAPPC